MIKPLSLVDLCSAVQEKSLASLRGERVKSLAKAQKDVTLDVAIFWIEEGSNCPSIDKIATSRLKVTPQ